ncbi:AraC family transcriptional regulator [Neolewinella xylanilytica]|uniref:AraC family transcriptional regulator n=1 Tax=Neolewinella xylanilytica TaxID=1514080 RepID=A0A2S6I1T5_9BACT|nr:GyrI-like domain-containing protein [Neolewinella xylanilytica]PPK85138.1 AraC family transcriptional regulator [Neolewinella xylanilytica]
MDTNVSILSFTPITLIGLSETTSLAGAGTPGLWRGFGPRIREIENRADEWRYSLRIYPADLSLARLTPETEYTEWAAVAVVEGTAVPDGLEKLELAGGLYARCLHRGLPGEIGTTVNYLFGQWLPTSGYDVDNSRPHFERMAPDYLPDDPDAQEEMYVPLQVLPLE